jgi:hypothetical protein
VWRSELACAIAEARHVTYTLHPEILGRPHRIGVLERLVEDVLHAGLPVVTHAEAAAGA